MAGRQIVALSVPGTWHNGRSFRFARRKECNWTGAFGYQLTQSRRRQFATCRGIVELRSVRRRVSGPAKMDPTEYWLCADGSGVCRIVDSSTRWRIARCQPVEADRGRSWCHHGGSQCTHHCILAEFSLGVDRPRAPSDYWWVPGTGGRRNQPSVGWPRRAGRMHYMRGDFTKPDTFTQLGKQLADQQKGQEAANALFYLAVADRFFGPVIEQLGGAGLTRQSEGAWRRVIVEKPFGHDFASAEALNAQILKILSEDQIYRIDPFLGKETVQNILVLRFANGIFEPLWNRDHIDHIQITAAEIVGVEARGRFYEKTGALRDMVPNHLFQLLAMIAMEPPISFDADA